MSAADQSVAAAPRADGAPSRSMFRLYKPGQGYWTRMLSAVGAGTLVLAGAGWLWAHLARIREDTIYWQAGIAGGMIAVFGAIIFFILNRPKVADFMIATEVEMKKVNWPSRREIVGATIVVIAGTTLIALLLFGIDIAFGWLFMKLGVLETGAGADAM